MTALQAFSDSGRRRPSGRLTLERLAELTGAEQVYADFIPHPGYRGECPVCGSRRYLWMDPDPDGTAVVECISGHCEPAAILAAFKMTLDDVTPCTRPGMAHAFTVPHSLNLGAVASTNRFARLAIDRAGLAALPDPEPLIAETLDRRTVALLAGYHGTGKSFVALDWAASVATGTPWIDRAVHSGRVLYVVGEGAYGIDQRLAAWEEHRATKIEPGRFVVIPRGVQITNPDERRDFLAFVSDGDFGLIVLDTLARCAVGLDENAASDMGLFVDALGEISQTSGATVLVVHHTGKDRSTVRGSSALESGMDTVYTVEADELTTVLKRTKRKDGPTFDEHHLRQQTDSIVFRPRAESETPDQSQILERAFLVLLASFGDRYATRAEMVRILREDGISQATAYRKIAELDAREVLDYVSTPGDKTTRYRVDRSAALAAGLPLGPVVVPRGGPSLHTI